MGWLDKDPREEECNQKSDSSCQQPSSFQLLVRRHPVKISPPLFHVPYASALGLTRLKKSLTRNHL